MILLAVSSADVALMENVRIMQDVVNDLERLLESVNYDEDCDSYGYYLQVRFTGDRGRPKIEITKPMVEYFFGHGFSATSTARLLHVSLSTLRRRMVEFRMMIRAQYSDISDDDLDRMVRSIQDQYPNCGYRMMQGHLKVRNHRVQQSRVREAMARTDPHGVISRWCNTVVKRTYSVRSPNTLWHIDGNHRLIRYVYIAMLISSQQNHINYVQPRQTPFNFPTLEPHDAMACDLSPIPTLAYARTLFGG